MKSLEIIASAKKIVEEISNYSKSQKNLWQKIPLLALEADGISGFNDNYSRAYREGFWALEGSIDENGYSIYVDLSSGELIDAYSASKVFSICNLKISKNSMLEPAQKEKILKLAFNIKELNAQNIVNSLKKESKQPYSSYYDSSKQKKWRTKTKTELNLPKKYTRENCNKNQQ